MDGGGSRGGDEKEGRGLRGKIGILSVQVARRSVAWRGGWYKKGELESGLLAQAVP